MPSSLHKIINYFSLYVFLPLLAFMIFAKTVGVSYESSFIFAGKVFLCDIIPGAFFLRLIRPDIQSPLIIALYAPAVGMVLEITTSLLFSVLGIQNYFVFYYILPILMIIVFTKRFFKGPWHNDENIPKFLGYTALVFLTLTACTIPFIQSGLRPWLDDDILVQVIIAQSIQQGYPFHFLLSEGRPFFYNFCYHVFVEATQILSGESTFLLTTRLAPVYCFSSLFFFLLAFCINHLKRYKYLLASLLMIQLFAVVGVNVEIIGKVFGGMMSAPLSRVHSNILGFTFTLLLSDFILSYLKHPPSRYNLFLLGTILLIAFITAGTRSATMVFITGGLSLLFFFFLLSKNKKSAQHTFIVGLTIGISFIIALLFFYGIHTPEAATSHQSIQGISGQIRYIMHEVPWAFSLSQLRLYAPETIAGLIVICVLIIFKAGFLSFAYIASISTIISERFRTAPENIYYLGGFLLTLIVWLEVMVPGGGQYPYFYYTGLGASLLAVTFLSSHSFSSKFLKGVVLVGTATLFAIHVSELFYHLIDNRYLLIRRYQKNVSNYTDLVGPGLENIINYLKPRAQNSAIAISWGDAPRYAEPIVPHLIIAETGVPILNDPKYMHPDGIVSPHSPLYTVYLNRLNASQTFWRTSEKAITQLYQSLQDKNRTLYILSYYPIETTFQNIQLDYILTDFFYTHRYPYILYKVRTKEESQ